MPVAEAASYGNRAAARTATSPTAVRIGRLGFAARGAVYMIVGWLALRAAVAGEETATDKQGAPDPLLVDCRNGRSQVVGDKSFQTVNRVSSRWLKYWGRGPCR
jgi:hypothetical protein